MSRSDYFNSEGYPDPTAYSVIREENELERKVSLFVKAVKEIAEISGLAIIGRFEVVDKKSGRHFK